MCVAFSVWVYACVAWYVRMKIYICLYLYDVVDPFFYFLTVFCRRSLCCDFMKIFSKYHSAIIVNTKKRGCLCSTVTFHLLRLPNPTSIGQISGSPLALIFWIKHRIPNPNCRCTQTWAPCLCTNAPLVIIIFMSKSSLRLVSQWLCRSLKYDCYFWNWLWFNIMGLIWWHFLGLNDLKFHISWESLCESVLQTIIMTGSNKLMHHHNLLDTWKPSLKKFVPVNLFPPSCPWLEYLLPGSAYVNWSQPLMISVMV